MIDAMETLLEHWGEQRRCKGLGGGAASPLAGMMEWKGAPPRGAGGAVMLLGGAGLDHAASQVEAALGFRRAIPQGANWGWVISVDVATGGLRDKSVIVVAKVYGWGLHHQPDARAA